MRIKKKIIIVGVMILVMILLIVGLYFYGLTPVKSSSEKVLFTVDSGTGTTVVIDNLKKNKLIKSKISTSIYYKLSDDIVIKAGTYELNRNYSTNKILKVLSEGKSVNNAYQITFKEGKKVFDYMKSLSESYHISIDEINNTLSDKDYLNELVSKYWFLTNSILDDRIYYPLEGYLFPDTYEFSKDASIKEVIEKILDTTEIKLNKYKSSIESSNYNVHEIMTMASIIENESKFDEDRSVVSQVIYKRLGLNMSLGMDVTSYYGVRKDLTENLTTSDLNNRNPYNTRLLSFIGLPVGPISNPSEKSIIASLNPSNTDYIYFYAEMKTGKLHFAKTNEEFQELIRIYS